MFGFYMIPNSMPTGKKAEVPFHVETKAVLYLP